MGERFGNPPKLRRFARKRISGGIIASLVESGCKGSGLKVPNRRYINLNETKTRTGAGLDGDPPGELSDADEGVSAENARHYPEGKRRVWAKTRWNAATHLRIDNGGGVSVGALTPTLMFYRVACMNSHVRMKTGPLRRANQAELRTR